MFALIAAREAARFRGSGIRIGNSSVVHSVEHVEWFGDNTLPAPTCHAGFNVKLDRMSPVQGAVTCRNCRRVRGVDVPHGPHGDQLAMFDVPLASS